MLVENGVSVDADDPVRVLPGLSLKTTRDVGFVELEPAVGRLLYYE